jgi:hypothetical protein
LKKRIAMLWILMAVAMSAHSIVLFMEMVEKVELPLEGEVYLVIIPEWMMEMDLAIELFMMSLFWLIPLWMAFLSVTLKGSANRWLNMILGIVFTILNIWHITEPCCTMVHQKLIVVSTIIATALIVWYAWKMPKQKT